MRVALPSHCRHLNVHRSDSRHRDSALADDIGKRANWVAVGGEKKEKEQLKKNIERQYFDKIKV